MTSLVRSQVVRSNVLELAEPKLFLVVSNNPRNRNFDQVICTRLTTTTPKHPKKSIVAVQPGETFSGWVACDDLLPIWDDEVMAVLGALGPTAMRAVDEGLMAALGTSR